jgi:putative flippase GtrA
MNMGRFFRFMLVGTLNTVIGSLIMFLLYNAAHVSYWIASACNYCFTSILSFFMNKYFTFKVFRWSPLMVVTFILTIAVSYGTAYGIAKPVMNYLLRNSSQNIRENIALFTGMCLFPAFNYAGQRFIVFKE